MERGLFLQPRSPARGANPTPNSNPNHKLISIAFFTFKYSNCSQGKCPLRRGETLRGKMSVFRAVAVVHAGQAVRASSTLLFRRMRLRTHAVVQSQLMLCYVCVCGPLSHTQPYCRIASDQLQCCDNIFFFYGVSHRPDASDVIDTSKHDSYC